MLRWCKPARFTYTARANCTRIVEFPISSCASSSRFLQNPTEERPTKERVSTDAGHSTGQIWSIAAKVQPCWANARRMWGKIGGTTNELVIWRRICAKLANAGHIRICPMLAESGSNMPNVNRREPNIGQSWPNFTELGQV